MMNRQRMGTWVGFPGAALLLAGSILGWTTWAFAQESSDGSDIETRVVEVALYKSRIVELPVAVDTVSVGNPDIADVRVMHARQLHLVGNGLGTTNVVVWDRDERVQAILNVHVTHDLDVLKATLHEMLRDQPIEVRSAQKNLVLSGQVSSAVHMDTALQLARSYAGGTDDREVINMMEIGGAQQVMLDVKVAEVQRTLVKRLGIQFDAFGTDGGKLRIGAVQGGANFPDAIISDPVLGDVRVPVFDEGTPIGPMVREFATSPSIEDIGLFGSYQSGSFLFNLVLEAAHQEGVAKILAEPNLTTQTGQEAHFLAGGEFPVPVPQQEGQTTIEYREFGVALKFLPVVLSSDAINLKVDVSVSDLGSEASLALGLGSQVARQISIPSLTKRSASSTVELGSGQTIAIAGMIDENLRDNVDKFPGLAELPIIGRLFRSEEFMKEQTEVVIFVTPRLARPIEPQQVRLPTGSFVAPGDLEFYLLGRRAHGGGDSDDDGRSDEEFALNPRTGGTAGRFGHGM